MIDCLFYITIANEYSFILTDLNLNCYILFIYPYLYMERGKYYCFGKWIYLFIEKLRITTNGNNKIDLFLYVLYLD